MKAAAAAVMAVCAASAAHAAGFMLTEQSAGALGRAYAGVGVDGTDISGVYYNPATMTLHPGTQIQAGFVAVGLDLAFEGTNDYAGVTENGQAIPHGYISHQLTDSMWIGLAMTVPFGMGTEYKDDWRLANRGISAEVLTFDFNPNVAWKVSDKLSLGAGMSIQYAAADLKMQENLGIAKLDGEVDADSIAWGFNFGLMWSPLENLRFGLSYRSKVNHNAEGDFTIDNIRDVSDGYEYIYGLAGTYGDARATISAPAWAMATAAWDVNELLSLYATFRWTDWSSFDTLDIKSSGLNPVGGVKTVENHWQDTYLVSVGADLRFTNWWTFRAGIGYETSAVDDPKYRTAIIPDADRLWLALGSSFKATENMQIDVSAAWLHGIGERNLWSSDGSNPIEGTPEKAGKFEDLDAYLFGVQLVYKF
jgi:long-chain fatty acid transport protein